MANDSSTIVKRHFAKSACYSLALLAQMGEMKDAMKDVMKDAMKDAESLLFEEDGNGNENEKTKESKKSELDSWLKILRKDRGLGKNEVIREFLLPIALYVAPFLCCMLRVSDKFFQAARCRP